jgi:hypothetical protein
MSPSSDFTLNQLLNLFILLLTVVTKTCADGFLKCKNGQCILKESVCKGHRRCNDGTVFPDADCR